MKKIIFAIFLVILFSISIKAQQNHFIYLQTEGKQPFYVKLDKKILSSSTAGYLIIPKLTQGNYTLLLGFPKNEWAEQTINVTIKKNDLGYLVKNFNEKGWALVDMNSYQIIYNNTNQSITNKPVEKIQPITAMPPTQVVKETPNPVIKEESKPIEKTKVIEVVKEISKQIVKEEPKEEILTTSKIIKLFSSKSNVGVESVYLIKNNNSIDTVRVFIPFENSKSKTPNPLVETQAAVVTPKEEIINTPINAESAPLAKELEKQIEQKKPIEQAKNTPKKVVEIPAKELHQTACKSLANEDEYKKLRKKMASADNDNAMLQQALSVFQKQCYTTEQIKTLSFLFLTDDGKYKFFDTAYPFVYDLDNFSKLSQLLTEEYYIKRFNAMLKN